MEATTKIFRKMVFYKQVLEFHCPSKFLCQTSGRQNHWSLLGMDLYTPLCSDVSSSKPTGSNRHWPIYMYTSILVVVQHFNPSKKPADLFRNNVLYLILEGVDILISESLGEPGIAVPIRAVDLFKHKNTSLF